jgi:hypothetical protein
MICHDCGTFIQINRDGVAEIEIEIAASLSICPHCLAVAEIRTSGGEEWCSECGLDPNIEDLQSPDLGLLWKKSSGIRDAMERDVRSLRPDRPMGIFLRSRCGPHCIFEEDCPQATPNLIKCYKEESALGEDMGKKSRRQRRQERRLQQKHMRKTNEGALVKCAGSGWFEKVLYVKSPNPQQAGDTGSGSGTQRVS